MFLIDCWLWRIFVSILITFFYLSFWKVYIYVQVIFKNRPRWLSYRWAEVLLTSFLFLLFHHLYFSTWSYYLIFNHSSIFSFWIDWWRVESHLSFLWNSWFFIAVLFQFTQNNKVLHVSCVTAVHLISYYCLWMLSNSMMSILTDIEYVIYWVFMQLCHTQMASMANNSIRK